jgi:hypothetical protein
MRKELDVTKSKAVTDPTKRKLTTFFSDVGIPSLLVEKMNQTPPTDIYIVDTRWLIDHELDKAIAYQPAFLDVVEKKCGADPTIVSYKQGRSASPEESEAFNRWLMCENGVQEHNREISLKALERGTEASLSKNHKYLK